MTERIGFIGLGRMGVPMATNLAKAGYALTVYNRTPKTTPLDELGATWAGSPAEVASRTDIVITMLSDSAAVEKVILGPGGVLEGAAGSKVIIDMSTIAPKVARHIAREAASKGVHTLDAPVAGSVKPAQEGTLVILVGGPRDIFDRCLPVLQVMGKKVVHMGDHGQGLVAKLAINVLLGLTTQALAESVNFARRAGLDIDTFLDALASSAVGSSPYINYKIPLLKERNYPTAFSLDHMHKDLGLALEEAHTLMAPMPAAASSFETFSLARAQGLGGQDLMAVIKALEPKA
ncbi:MAG: NAD(P)-dependent oxidoreductase [Peptococcaceae bacterium]|nr:NAD(P)-dependent oxidoreductase [Peptococcaceae bacterium]